MGFHEESGDTDCCCGPGQGRHEFTLTAGGTAFPARLLYRMGGVEDHGTTGLRHDRQGPHVGNQGVVAEGDAPLANHDPVVAGLL